MTSTIDYKAEVLKVYPDAYLVHNTIFEYYVLYENHRCDNRISERCERGYETWQSAYETITKTQTNEQD